MMDGRLLVLAYPMMPPDACRHEPSQRRPKNLAKCLENAVKYILVASMWAMYWKDQEGGGDRAPRAITHGQGTKDV